MLDAKHPNREERQSLAVVRPRERVERGEGLQEAQQHGGLEPARSIEADCLDLGGHAPLLGVYAARRSLELPLGRHHSGREDVIARSADLSMMEGPGGGREG